MKKKSTTKKEVRIVMQRWAVDNPTLLSIIPTLIDAGIITSEEARQMIFIEKEI